MNHAHPLPVLPAQAHLRVLPSTLPSVFDYDDYHAFLRDWVASRKTLWPAYSLQLLANRAKIKSRSFLRLVCLGERRLGHEVAETVAIAMGLGPDARQRFLELVEEERMKDALHRLRARAKTTRTVRVPSNEPLQAHATQGGIGASSREKTTPGIELACRFPRRLTMVERTELDQRLRSFQEEMETWLGGREITSAPVPAGDPISA